MRVILDRGNDLRELEAKINKKLEELEDTGHTIKGITSASHMVPKMRGKEVVGHDVFWSVMIAYTR